MTDALTLPAPDRGPGAVRHALALEEVRFRGAQRALVFGAAVLLVAGTLWAAATPLPETAIAPGEVTTALARAPVQHLEGGIIAAVEVAEGVRVAAGDPIVRIDDTAARADLRQLEVRGAALRLHADRLRAFVAGRAATLGQTAMPVPPPGLGESQAAALAARLAALADRLATAEAQRAQRTAEAETLGAQIAASAAQIDILRSERDTRDALAETGLTTRMAVLEARRLVLSAEAERTRLVGTLAAARRAEAEAAARIDEVRSTAIDEAQAEAARLAQEIAETDAAVTRLTDRVTRSVVRAPSAGIVRGLAVERAGSVIPPGALIAEIQPEDGPLVVDARVAPRDIGFIVPGQPVTVKVLSYDYARYGTLPGRVERISAGSFQDQDRQPYHRVRVALDRLHVGANPAQTRVSAGMSVQADITTGHKSVLQYLLKPLYAYRAEAFHER